MFDDAKTSGWVGSLLHMAPEILLEKPYWFSTGVVIYEMATGRYPFYIGELDETTIEALINADPAFPKGLDLQAKSIIEGPPVMTSDIMKDVLSFTEAIKPPMAETDQKLFCGFTFASDGWKVIKKTPKPVISHRGPAIPHHRTFGSIVKATFHKIWRRIKRWK
ncbi:RAC serine/threonine-protein kinase-like [Ranitomeya imitator]|uniref:RAC serine/threonine-protein kinase-like n=1 Tax=Ranitomeya imitator TaxID=111125 RepID=UPI0037E7CAD5